MIKNYIFYIVLMFSSVSIAAQNNVAKPSKFIAPKSNPSPSINKMMGCTDVILYPQSKASNILLDTMDYVTYIGAVGQIYNYTGSGLIHGINVYMTLDLDGISGNKDSVSMVISVRNLGTGKIPTTILGSDTVFVHDVGFNTQNLLFSSPITVTDSFVIVIEIDTLHPSNPYYATNDYGDGSVEQLSVLADHGVWYNLYPTWGGTWDVDMMLSPIFEDLVVPSYSVDTNNVCIGTPIKFTNTSYVSYNTMFNTAKASFNLDLGEFLTVVTFDSNYSHVYSSGGVFNTMFEIVQYGYSLNCVIDSTFSVTVIDTSSANFSFNHLGSGTYQFTDASLNGTTYYWDFGDGDTSTMQNPTHTFLTANTYNVCLTVVNDSVCGTSVMCQDVSFVVGQKENVVSKEVKIYPIPAKRFFTVEIPTTFVESTVIVTDIVGKQIKTIEEVNLSKVKILTDEFNSGVYFVSVTNNGQKVFTKRIIIDK